MSEGKDKIIINNEKLFNIISNLQDKQNKMLQVLNNGIKREVHENSKRIEGLGNKVNTLSDKINAEENKEKGSKETKSSIREWSAWVIAILSLIVAVISFTGGF